ncbi:serine/threonine-protein kinase haspin [Arapaima gigas]
MSTFKRNGPVYLKTYGKNKRKMEMWLSPDVRKKAFSSTSSSDLSISLMSNSSLLPQRKKKPTRSSRMTRAAKKRALTALKEKDSDEENIYHLNAEPCQNDQKRKGPFTTALPKQTKKKRKKPLVLVISESEDESEENSAETGQKRTCMGKPIKSVRSDNTPLLLADVGRFVTNRRKQHEKQKSTNKRKVQTKENVCIFDSSADSTEDFVRPHVPHPPKDRPVTGRKACISGLSVSRWTRKEGWQKKKGGHTGSFITKTGDSSMVDFQLGFDNRKCHVLLKSSLLSTADVLPATPTHKEPMNVLSFLANFSPDCMTTHTWGKLKAALSVHKKKKVFITPHKLHLSQSRLFDEGVMDASREHPAFTQCTPLSQHLIARLPMSAEGVSLGLCSYAEDLTDAEKVYHECQQEGPITFEQCIPPDKMKLCKKIGEGTFGEVFSIVNDSMETVALKIIPIEGDQKVNGEEQKTFGEILQEIISSKELSSLGVRDNNRSQGFIGLNNLHCVQGPYPDLLLAAWDKFDEQRVSENDRPDFFPDNQLFLILEFEFGGSDLENFNCKLSSLVQAKSILHQVTVALAVAEQALCFEHRDLHWGNILVKNTVEKKGTYILNGIPHTFETKGVLVNIIDYSLSRLEIDGLTVFCDISANDELFMGQGDYQFDIYRKMREENNNSWSEYNPHTNVLWLRYLADKLLHVTYKNKSLSKPVKVLKKNLRKFYDEVLQFKSASSVLEGSSLFK